MDRSFEGEGTEIVMQDSCEEEFYPYEEESYSYEEPISVGEADKLALNANGGDIEAFARILRSLGLYAQEVERCPQTLVEFIFMKAGQLEQHKDFKVLGEPYKKSKPGKRSIQLFVVRMVHYLVHKKGMAMNAAIAQVAKDLCVQEGTVSDHCYYWTNGIKRSLSPKGLVDQDWRLHLPNDDKYDDCRKNVLSGKDNPITPLEMMTVGLMKQD